MTPSITYSEKVSALAKYRALDWLVTSCELVWDPERKKKKILEFHCKWQSGEAPVCRPEANGFALLTGEKSGVTAIDIDDPALEHNQLLSRLCDEAGAVKQTTKKGHHYIFRYTDRLKTVVGGEKLALDVRNENGCLFCEPSAYAVDGRLFTYRFQNLPADRADIPECPPAVVELVLELMASRGSRAAPRSADPKERKAEAARAKQTVQARAKTERSAAADIARTGVGAASVAVEDLRLLLQKLDVRHADSYDDWISVGMALHHSGAGWELFDEFSRRSAKYVENEPFYVFSRFDEEKEKVVTAATLYWWLKAEDRETFELLVTRESEDAYQRLKAEFEQRNFFVGKHICHVKEDGTLLPMTPCEAKHYYANQRLGYEGIPLQRFTKNKMRDFDFLSLWLKDPARKGYERQDFRPDVAACPANVYNLFKGLRGERLAAVPREQRDALVAPVLELVESLTSGEGQRYFLMWLANMVQAPWKKSEVGVVIRDLSERLLSGGGGTGKNVFIEFFGRRVLGEEHFLVISDNAQLYDAFSEHREGKILIFVEETNGNANSKNLDLLKALITCLTLLVNRKGVPKYLVRDFARYIFATNHGNPIPGYGGTPSDRRFAYFDASHRHRGDAEYWKRTTEHLERDDVARAFYDYLMDLPTLETPGEFQHLRPVTRAFHNVRYRNAKPIVQWLVHRVESELPVEGSVATLFADFQAWLAVEQPEQLQGGGHQLTKRTFASTLVSNEDVMSGQDARSVRCRGAQGVSYIRLDRALLRAALLREHYMRRSEDVRDYLTPTLQPAASASSSSQDAPPISC